MSGKSTSLTDIDLEPRKPQKKAAQPLPKEFLTKCAGLFREQFSEEMGSAEVTVYGSLFMDEAVLCLALQELNRSTAFAFYASVDLKPLVAQKPEQVTLILRSLIDLMASWVSQTYEESNANGLEPLLEAIREMSPGWQATEWDGRTVYVKLSRDNLLLESAADKFLRENDSDA